MAQNLLSTLAVVQLLLLLSHLSFSITATTKSNSNSTNVETARYLSHSAPYAFQGDQQSVRHNIKLHLDLNQIRRSSLSPESVTADDPWTFVSSNGTLLSSRASLNLKKLLQTLNSSNLTSDVKLDEKNPGFVNITISNLKDFLDKSSPKDELLLEELLMDANSKWRQAELNESSVLKDNHRYESRHPVRSKPALVEAVITPPPIRAAIEVVAENYTTRKIAEEANIFALKLLHQLNVEKLGSHNIIQAPFSVYQGLTLLLSGAMGDTAKELDKTLLGRQSPYENTKLTHDQDRPRLLASLNEVIRKLQQSSSHHFRTQNETSQPAYLAGGSLDQHLIVANHLLFSPSAYEISGEFKNTLQSYYNNTALSKIEVGSIDSIQMVNAWIRRATAGNIPSILDKKSPFDEFNVMALLCTSWLAQQWRDTFYRISSSLRSSIRLKGQARSFNSKVETLLEFVDDAKQSHFVDYIKSRPTQSIHHFRTLISDQLVDVVSVPFQSSNHRFIALTPVAIGSSANITTQQFVETTTSQADHQSSPGGPVVDPPDWSPLSKLVAAFASNPRKTVRTLWNTIAPEIITKQILKNIELARQKNVTSEEGATETHVPPMVQLSIPLMKSEAHSTISAALNHIGVVNSFEPNQANFIGINGHPFNYYKLHLSNVLSKTTFNLNERGINYDKTIQSLESLRILPDKRNQPETEIDENSAPDRPELVDEIKLDKPFMYLVCDIKTKLILYTGILRNPEQVVRAI